MAFSYKYSIAVGYALFCTEIESKQQRLVLASNNIDLWLHSRVQR